MRRSPEEACGLGIGRRKWLCRALTLVIVKSPLRIGDFLNAKFIPRRLVVFFLIGQRA